jgi:parvulin-like peptidyl-prolyl isomerase
MERSPAMVRAAFALETPGQMTDIVETEQGFAIGKLLAVTPELQLTFEGAKEGILQSLRGELAKSTRAQIQESLQAPADFALTDDAALKKMITLEQKSRGAESSDQ